MRVLLLLLLSGLALADPITLQCQKPTKNEDGSDLTNLAGIRFYESDVAGGPYSQIGDEEVCELVIEREPGTYYFVATAYTTATNPDGSAVESRYSNEISKTVVGSVPEPPSGLVALADSVAYALQQTVGGLTMYPVGIVSTDTPCDAYISITTAAHPDGLGLIPRANVTFAGQAEAYTVYAKCVGG